MGLCHSTYFFTVKNKLAIPELTAFIKVLLNVLKVLLHLKMFELFWCQKQFVYDTVHLVFTAASGKVNCDHVKFFITCYFW